MCRPFLDDQVLFVKNSADDAIAVKRLRSRGEGGACRPRRKNADAPPPLRGAVCMATGIPLPPAGAADVPGISARVFGNYGRRAMPEFALRGTAFSVFSRFCVEYFL